ncbi:response regulator transcription factor [Synoicihabitans lomoniglobus]|uniref:Response regulator transcription factor n=1 Tax=Synoicihabitans lomoniglobus TaxID=2909285 RepID=A0AAF0CPZ8_9BACT|nr:response regulator transcription factor [Opitutaceae bacterium LMO-M01]WED65920.1 response regulator transcription factor [Opitutaceae bacterium LMO-M01]
MRILVVEDEKKVAGLISAGLTEQGWAVEVCHNGDEGLLLANEHTFDAMVLDVMLPGRDGLSLLRKLRSQRNTVPVILLTARGDVNERVEGLELGADDYMPKPFSVVELVARLRAIVRRHTGDTLSVLSHGDLSLNLHQRTVRRAGTDIDLTAREFALLETFLSSPGRVLSRTFLCQRVWGYQFDPETNVVDVAVQRLRRKIDDDFTPKLIQTVRGVGYSLASE